MHNLQIEPEESPLSTEIFDLGLRPILNDHVIETVADFKINVLKDYANKLWLSDTALLEKIIISKGLLPAYAATQALKIFLVYGPDYYSYHQQYQDNGKVALALGFDQLLYALVGLGIKDTLPFTVVSGLADLCYERTRASSDHIRWQLASRLDEVSQQAALHFDGGQYRSALSYLIQTASLCDRIEAIEMGRLSLLLFASPYKVLNGLREALVDGTYQLITVSKEWLSKIFSETDSRTVSKSFYETSPFDLVTTGRQPYFITENFPQGKSVSIDVPIPIYNVSCSSQSTSSTVDRHSEIQIPVTKIPQLADTHRLFPTEQKIGASKFFSSAFIKPLQWISDDPITVFSSNTTRPPITVLPSPQIVKEILRDLFVLNIERVIDRPHDFKISSDYEHTHLTTTLSDANGIGISKSGINYRADINSELDFYGITDWLSIARMAVYIGTRIRECFLEPEQKIYLTLLRQVHAYAEHPNSTDKSTLITTIHDFYRLNPHEQQRAKLALFAVETNRLFHLEMLFDKKCGGAWIAELNKYYHEGLIEQTTPVTFFNETTKSFTSELPNLSKLAARFPLEARTHYRLARDKRSKQQFEAALENTNRGLELADTPAERRTFEHLKHAILLEKVEQNPNMFSELKTFHQDWQQQYPKDKSLRRLEMQDSLHFQKPEVALPLLREVCEDSSANSDDYYRRGHCEEQLGLTTAAAHSYQQAIDKASTPAALIAYLSRKKLIALIEQEKPAEALKLWQKICEYPCTMDDVYALAEAEAKMGTQTKSIEAFSTYIQLCKKLQGDKLENAKPKLNNALITIAEFYEAHYPDTAVLYYLQYLKINSDALPIIQKCERIYLQQRNWQDLQRLYQHKHTRAYPEYVQKLENLKHFRYWDRILNKVEGASAFVQLATELFLRGKEDESKCSRTKRLASSLSLGASITQKLWAPYQRWRTESKVTGDTLKPGQYLYVIYNSFIVATAIFHYLQVINPDLAKHDSVKTINAHLQKLEGVSFLVEGAFNYPRMQKQFADLCSVSKKLYVFFKETMTTQEMSQCVVSSQALIESGIPLTENVMGDISSIPIIPGPEVALQKSIETYGSYALGIATTVSLVWRFSEFLLRDRYGIPEVRGYHMTKNIITYVPVTLSIAGSLGLTTAVGTAVTKGVVAGAALKGWVVSSIAAGGTKAVIGVVGGGGALVGGYFVCLGAYKSIRWIDNWTTGRDQRNAIEHNAILLAGEGEFALATEKLRQIAKPTIRVIQNLQYYTCHQEFKAKHYEKVIDITSKQLSECKELDSSTKSAYQQLRLYSLANSTLPASLSIDTMWQDYEQLQREIKDVEQRTAQTDAMFSILSKASRQAVKADELTRAIAHYDRMIILKPEQIELNTERRYYEYQLHYQNPKEHPSLLAKCKNVLLTTATDPVALRFSGLIYLQQQDLENAELYFSKLVTAKTDNVEAMMYLTDIARSKQAYCSAQRWAEQALLITQNTYNRHIKDEKTVTSEAHHQEIEAHLAQQLAATKKQVETIKSDIFAIWCSAAGRSMGEVTYHILGDMMQLGISKINHRTPTAYDNLILPFWEKSRTTNTLGEFYCNDCTQNLFCSAIFLINQNQQGKTIMSRQSINFDKIGTSIVKAIEEPHFWSSFVSTVGSAFFIGFSKMVLTKLWNRSVANVEHIAKVDEAYQRGLAFHNKAQYQDAVKEFRFAKDHFDQMLNVLLQSNTRLHQLYSNICYSYALALTAVGEYTIALVILDACNLKQQQWRTSHTDADIPNLYGAIYLKQKQYQKASAAFSESLGIDYNQEDIQLLQAYASLKIPQDEKISRDEKISLIELSEQEQRNIIVTTKLFRPQHVTVIAFEVNVAHLQILLDAQHYSESVDKLEQLESSYTAIPLAAADRSRLYELFVIALQHLPVEVIKEEKQDISPLPFPMSLMARSPTRKPLNKEEKEKLITEYELKLKKAMPKAMEVVMHLTTPVFEEIKQTNTLMIYPVDAYWLFKQQSKNHRITNQELLQTLKIASLRELPSRNGEYCLSYHQKWVLLKYFRTLHSDKLNKRSTQALLSYGIVAALGVKVVASVCLQNTNSYALGPK